MKNLVKVFIGMVIIIVIVIAGIWGKNYMDKRAEKKEYIRAVEETQQKASQYIIENYSGVEKIEWNGWSSSDFGPKGVDTSMTINGYQDELNGKVQLGYSALNPEWIEKYTDSVLTGSEYSNGQEQENKFKKLGIEKNEKGSPGAQIIYNLEENH